jgi:hypothetical protein
MMQSDVLGIVLDISHHSLARMFPGVSHSVGISEGFLIPDSRDFRAPIRKSVLIIHSLCMSAMFLLVIPQYVTGFTCGG